MNINIDSINGTSDLPICIATKDIWTTTKDDAHLQDLRMYI